MFRCVFRVEGQKRFSSSVTTLLRLLPKRGGREFPPSVPDTNVPVSSISLSIVHLSVLQHHPLRDGSSGELRLLWSQVMFFFTTFRFWLWIFFLLSWIYMFLVILAMVLVMKNSCRRWWKANVDVEESWINCKLLRLGCWRRRKRK